MRKLPVLFIFLCMYIYSSAQIIFTKPQSERIANYHIKANLDTEKKIVSGSMQLSWKNSSQDTVRELQFHTYMNAFKNTASTFIKESGGQLRGDYIETGNDKAWGWIEISKFKDASGYDYTSEIRYIQPDDDNEKDQTVISINLNKGIAPGESAEFDIDFETKLPKIFARTGYVGNYFMVGQWFPKIGVYQDGKGWNCHQFHAHSEFFADFGVYDVELTVPESYVVGASGGLQKTVPNEKDKTNTFFFRAEDVVDFAWTASQRYQEKNYKWKDVNVRILLQPEHFKFEKRHSESLNAALEYFEKHIGKYPYKNITVIDPPSKASGAGGMEYPTLITAGSFSLMPKGLRMIEMVVVHEFGHQYFMALLASNEFEEAWMDEGMNTYFETRIMDATYGEGAFLDMGGFKMSDIQMQRTSYVRSGYTNTVECYRKAWEYPNGGYSVMSYSKPATFFTTYERMVGQKVTDEIFKTYFAKFKFKHPVSEDFIRIAKEITRKHYGDKIDADAFFKQVVYGSQDCDYQIKRVSSKRYGGLKGKFDAGENKTSEKDISKDMYHSTVKVFRDGELIIPTDLKVTFKNGDTKLVNWDGKEKMKIFSFDNKYPIIKAELDPEQKNLLDKNLNNNSYVKKKDPGGIWKVVLKIMFFFQNLMQSVAFFA